MKTSAPSLNPRVDDYIAKAQPFAQPILNHIREIMHRACPEVQEEIKWSMPFFTLNDIMLANMAGFKQHCAFGFMGSEMKVILNGEGSEFKTAMGSLGRITSLKDLPADKKLLDYCRQAAGFVTSGERTKSYSRPAKKAAKAPPEVPAELSAALKKNKAAAKVFAAFSPSCQREYTEWITEAKRAGTKDKRVAQAVEWIAEGKQRNWKYQNC